MERFISVLRPATVQVAVPHPQTTAGHLEVLAISHVLRVFAVPTASILKMEPAVKPVTLAV